jgi:hypothetical protein
VVESGVIRLEAPHEASFRQDRDNLTADEWLIEAAVTTGFEDRGNNSSGRVISVIPVVKREIGAGCATDDRVPMDHRVRGLHARRMHIVHVEGGQQREPQDSGDRPDRNDESDVFGEKHGAASIWSVVMQSQERVSLALSVSSTEHERRQVQVNEWWCSATASGGDCTG